MVIVGFLVIGLALEKDNPMSLRDFLEHRKAQRAPQKETAISKFFNRRKADKEEIKTRRQR